MTTTYDIRVTESDAQSYPVGRLIRASGGYEWAEDADGSLWIVAAWNGSRSVIDFRPPRGQHLLRRFAAIASDDAILEFAGMYGFLGEPQPTGVGEQVGERGAWWMREVEMVRKLDRLLDDARLAVSDWDWRPLAATFEMEDRPGDGVVIHDYGVRVAYDFGWAQSHGFRELESIARTRGDHAAKLAARPMSRFAGFCVQQAIGRRLRGAHVGIVYDYAGTVPQPPRIVPATALGAVYLELDNKLRAKPSERRAPEPRLCKGPGCRNQIEAGRRDKSYCGNACAQAAHRAGLARPRKPSEVA